MGYLEQIVHVDSEIAEQIVHLYAPLGTVGSAHCFIIASVNSYLFIQQSCPA